MAMEQPDSPGAQGKAVKMYRNVENPLEVYPGMNSIVPDHQNIMGFLVLLVCVVIAAPVFSADYQSGADDILRCTRYGRVTLAIAKLFAAFLISTAAFVICTAVHILTADSLFGWECTRTSVQMMYFIVTLADMDIGGGTLGIWLCSILPASGTSIQASVLYAITDFQFLNLAGLSVWMPYAMIGACMIEIPLFAFLAVRTYCRHALN